MKPPEGWDVHDETWWIKQVEIKPDRWLLMFYNYDGSTNVPAAWINLTEAHWAGAAYQPNFFLREHSIPHPGSMLELKCIELEWTEEILEGRTHAEPEH